MKKLHTYKDEMICQTCPNERCFIKQYCSAEWKSLINKCKSNIRCNSGQSVILEGSPIMGIYFIYQGKIKVTITGKNNVQQIVRLANDGHILGHRGEPGERYPIGAVAIQDSYLCFVDNDTLSKAFASNPEFTTGLMMFYSKELRKTETRIKYLSQMKVREKIIYAFIYLADSYGLTDDNMLDAVISRQEIAEVAGTTAEQVSREITVLKQEKMIKTAGKRIILHNYNKLREVVEHYFPFNY